MFTPFQLLPMSSPCVDQQQQQQQQTPTMEKLLHSENPSTNNNNNNLISNSNINSQGEQHQSKSIGAAGEDRLLGANEASSSSGVGSGTLKVSSGKRKMDFGSSSSSSNNSNSANYSGIASSSAGVSSNGGSLAARFAQLQRPTLKSPDYENIVEDALEPHQLLYDYSSCDAW